MTARWLSRYHPRYPRALAYMLQASEYDVRAYLAWYRRVEDFRNAEGRKRLVMTPKAFVVLACAWAIIAAAFAAAGILARIVAAPWGYLLAALLLLLTPCIAAYGIAIPLGLFEFFVQRQVAHVMIRRARKRLARHGAVKIAVAGSFGKTSMREILRTVLAEGKNVAAPPESYNTPLGISRFVAGLSGDEEVLVFEFGEYYPGDIRELCRMVRPDIGIITGVNEAHLEKFKTLERTAATMFELAEWLGERRLYVNTESGRAAAMARPGHIRYGRFGAEDWRVENAETGLEGTSCALIKGAKGEVKIRVASKLLGFHHLGALAVAADVASSLGLSLEEIQRGIAKTKPFPHRLEPREGADGVTLIDDSYNGNPDGVRAAIEFLAALKGRRRWYVTPGLVEMGPRSEAVHRAIGAGLARSGIEKVILIRDSVTPHIEAGLRDAAYRGDILWFDDALAAFRAIPRLTARGDVVLVQNDWPDQYL